MKTVMKGSTLHFLSLLFVLALGLRLVAFWSYLAQEERYWQVDSSTYHQVATQLVAGNGLVNPDGSAHFYRVPGYASFLAACYWVFGLVKERALIVQIVISACIPLVVYVLSLMLFPGYLWCARLVGVLVACHLGFVLYAGFMMTETLFILFLLLALCAFFKVVTERNRHYGIVILAGMLFGCASMIRPVGHYLIVVCIAIMFLTSQRGYRGRVYDAIALLFSWLLVVGGWLIRNYLLTGVCFFHTLPGGHFLYLSAARVAMQVHQVNYQQAREILENQVRATINLREQERGEILPEIVSCEIHEQLAKDYFLQRPITTLRCWITDMLRAAFSLYSAELLFIASGREPVAYFDKQHGFVAMIKRYLFPQTDQIWLRVVIYGELIWFMMLLGGLLCAIMQALWWGSGRLIVLQILPFMLLFIVISLAGGYARMRLPIEPLMMILSVHGWRSLFCALTRSA